MNQHPFWYSMSVHLDILTRLSVHPASPVLLTRNGPLEPIDSGARSIKYRARRVHLKFVNRLRIFHP